MSYLQQNCFLQPMDLKTEDHKQEELQHQLELRFSTWDSAESEMKRAFKKDPMKGFPFWRRLFQGIPTLFLTKEWIGTSLLDERRWDWKLETGFALIDTQSSALKTAYGEEGKIFILFKNETLVIPRFLFILPFTIKMLCVVKIG